MRLLLLTPEFSARGGGIATFYQYYLPAAVKLGLEVRVVEGSAFSASPLGAVANENGISVEQLEAPRLARWHERFAHFAAAPLFRRHIAAAWAMWEQALEGAEFDVVEATDWGLLFVPPIIAQSHPIVIQGHASCGQIAGFDAQPGEEVSNALLRLVELQCMQPAFNIQTLSQANASFWEAELQHQVDVIRPAWTPPERIAEHDSGAEGLVIGRLQSWKGPDTLCHALRLLGSSAPTVRWVGREVPWGRHDVSASAYLSEQFADLWGSRFFHEQPVSPDAVAGQQSRAAFNLVPSHWDVFNFTAIEAMASGRPTIVSLGAGASELISHGANGFVFKAGDAPNLAEVIDEVSALSKDKQEQIGDNAFETVRRELDPHKIAMHRIERYGTATSPTVRSAKPAAWTLELCSPPHATAVESDFLRGLPVRMLARHVARRLLNRGNQP